MEIDNILDALCMDGVTDIVQLCTCTYNDNTVEFRLINDDIGVVDEIEYKNDDNEWTLEYPEDNPSDSIALMVEAIENAPFDVFHKSDVGAVLKLNHKSIKKQEVPNHMRSDFYVDEDGPIVFKLEKNIITLD